MDTPQQRHKMSLETLSKEELIKKYKGLLTIAKKAKQSKDEIFEENCSLKEQLQQYETQREDDKKALMTMQEMLEAYTENKLQLTITVAELQKIRQMDAERIEKLTIANESLTRQIQRLTEDNESLLTDIENMEGQLKHVSGLSREQKEQLVLLQKEIAELKEVEKEFEETKFKNQKLNNELQELKEKYKFIKDINTEQRQKFNYLKDKFVEVHKKLKKLKECKRILLETQHEYADAVSHWQNEIVKASKILCKELNDLKEENLKLMRQFEKDHQLKENHKKNSISMQKLDNLLHLSQRAAKDFNELKEENNDLKKKLQIKASLSKSSVKVLSEMWQLSQIALQEYNDIRKENILLKQCAEYKDKIDAPKLEIDQSLFTSLTLQELDKLAAKAKDEFLNQTKELNALKTKFEKLKNETLFTTKNSLFKSQNECEQQLREKLKLLEEENNMYQNQIQELTHFKLKNQLASSASLQDALNKTQENNQKLSEKITCLEEENLLDKQRLANLSIEWETAAKEKLDLMEKIKHLKTVADTCDFTCQLKEQLMSSEQLLEQYQLKYNQKEIEHAELLGEMRELNEALKGRGDLISRQQEEHQILKTELKVNSEKLLKVQQEIDKKNIQLNEKQKELESNAKEILTIKQKLESLEISNSLNEEKVRVLSIELDNIKLNPSAAAAADFDNQSDVLSTSTISKADELQRLKDVEDSFEDKYNKLRGLAAKLKKKLQEETVLRQRFEKEVQDLKKQEKELNLQMNEFKSNKISDTDSLQKQINDKQKQVETLKTENQKLKSSRKQANVLNLEIEAAEKSLTEVTNKLASRTLELETAQESLKSKDSTISQLRKEIDLLESSKSAEVKHAQELKQQIDYCHKTLKDEMHSKQVAFEKSKSLEQDVENLKQELENIKLELTQATSNREKALKVLNDEREKLSLQISATQTALSECELKLKKSEKANEDLRIEYLDYKVKALAVLRNNQNRDSSKERELAEEIVAMRATETRLNANIEALTLKIESLEKQKDILNDDNLSLTKRNRELIVLIEDVRTQNETLNQEIQHHIQEQHEALKQHRQQIESIDICHKEQMQSINVTHQRQLEQLRKQLAQHIRLPPTVGAANKPSNLSLPLHIDPSSDTSKIDFLLMEREDAEGSEEAAETLANLAALRKISNDSSSSVKRSVQDFIPLDELLNTPLNAISTETLITNSGQQQQQSYGAECESNTVNTTDFLQLELNTTKERLQKQESRVRHLTTLLAENEQDLARLTQMNDMLKEELRRQERSVEREQHMHNSEYVKNVIMKFLTLNNADEKIRLVPVLNTILKLSRSEAEMLNCVAKGQKVSETSQRSGGWGNFLPWGGNNNNN